MIYYAEIQTALNFIEKNLDKPLTVDNIAAVAGFSKYHFHRIFRNETGCCCRIFKISFSQDIQKRDRYPPI